MARTSCPACGALTVGGVFPGSRALRLRGRRRSQRPRRGEPAGTRARAGARRPPRRPGGGGVPLLRAGPRAEGPPCEECDVRVDRPRCAACYRVASPGDADCARCGAELAPPRLRAADVRSRAPGATSRSRWGSVEPARVSGCAGTFLAHDALARVLEEARSLPPLDDAAPSSAGPQCATSRCPHCADRMNGRCSEGASGVVVDTCRRHGTFFDAASSRGPSCG